MVKKILKTIKYVFISILVLILILNLTIVLKAKRHPNEIPSLFGYKPFIVLSGSMETNISVGDLVITKEVKPSTLKIDDIIAFKDSEDLVTTHRIKESVNVNGEICYRTKGDANNTYDDGYVCPNLIEGKYILKIPKIGNGILFIQEPLGFIIMMLIIFIICILWYFIENKKIDNEINFESEEEKKEYEEFKRMKEENSKKKKNKKN